MRQWVSDFMARSSLREQFADLDRRGGLDEVLNDMGISRAGMDKVIRGFPEAGRLRPAMMKRVGVDFDKLYPRTRYEIGRTCTVCPSHRRCRRWLANAQPKSMEYRAFCPNAELFDAVLEQKP